MILIKMMLVPGKIVSLSLEDGATVMDAARAAVAQKPECEWVELAKAREVRVQNKKYANTTEVTAGTFGSIHSTPLKDGEVILVLTKIQGNDAVLSCTVDGEEFALESPVQVDTLLTSVVGVDLIAVEKIYLNGEEVELSRLVSRGDSISVEYYPPKPEIQPEPDSDEDSVITVKINGVSVTGMPADIRKIIG
jgi:hypothetical protein